MTDDGDGTEAGWPSARTRPGWQARVRAAAVGGLLMSTVALFLVQGDEKRQPVPVPGVDPGRQLIGAVDLNPPGPRPWPARNDPPPGKAVTEPFAAQPATYQRGIPSVVMDAYQQAEHTQAAGRPGCHLRWWLLAAIGQVESNHADNGRVDSRGTTLTPIRGPRLDGTGGYAAVRDTDGGALDGDPVWDRAVGPMQFIPSTWRRFGTDGNGDGVADPNNVFDAALSAAHYLCAGGRDLGSPGQLAAAVFSYNPSDAYVQAVLGWARAYASGASVIPARTGVVTAALERPAEPAKARPQPAPTRQPGSSGSPRPPQQPGGGSTHPTAPPSGGQSGPLTLGCLVDLPKLGVDPTLLGVPPQQTCRNTTPATPSQSATPQ